MAQTRYHKTADGASIAYRVLGEASGGGGVPLVLIMGLSGIMDDWSPFVEELAKSRKVLISDHRGIGQSKVPADWDYDLSHDVMINDILSVISSLGKSWSTVDILGWSMGGHILQRMLTRPESKVNKQGAIEVLKGQIVVRKAILTATMTKMPRGDLDFNKMQAEAAKIKDGPTRKRWATEEMYVYQYDPASLSTNSKLQKIMKDRIEVALHTSRPQEIIGVQLLSIGQYRSQNDLHRIPKSLPVLIIHGQLDRMVHHSETAPIEKGIPHAKRIDLSDGVKEAKEGLYGHFWFDYFEPSFWASKINAFLDGDGDDDSSNGGKTTSLAKL